MKKALVVGINAYEQRPLKGCVNDANCMAALLATNGDGSTNFELRLLTAPAEQITRAKLRRSIEELFSGDPYIALLYFSGHGAQTSTGGYILTSDTKRYDEGISMDEILKLANDSKARDKVIILDCCESGLFGSPALGNGLTTQLAPGLCVMAATRGGDDALEAEDSGVFTSLVADALRGGAASLRGDITPGAVYAHVDRALGAFSQRPIFKTNVSHFVSLRTVRPPVAPETLRNITRFFSRPTDELRLDPSYEFTQSCAAEENVAVFKQLQALQSVGVVVPVGAEYMYFAAIESQSCKLTALGQYYWRLAKERKI